MTGERRRFDCADEVGPRRGIAAAVDEIAATRLVVLPTDTVYGVAADAFEGAAVRRLLRAKGRGRNMPPPVLIASAVTPSTRWPHGCRSSPATWSSSSGPDR